LHFKWCPDGVVNNLDGADPTNEFKDFAIANVALQGFVRFSTLPFGDEAVGHNFPSIFTSQKGVRNGDRVYLVFTNDEEDANNKRKYRFRLVLASHITTGKFLPTNEAVGMAWSLGRVVDGNQSKNMVTLCVGIEPMWEGEHVGWGLTPADILCLKWMDGRTDEQKERLRQIRVRAYGPPPPVRNSPWSYKQWFERDLVGNFDGAPFASALG
jgi:hypothetical protein